MPLGRSSLLCIALASSFFASPAGAQQEEPKKSLAEELFPPDDPREEIVRLFHEIEGKLQSIDLELAEASAGDRSLAGVEDSGSRSSSRARRRRAAKWSRGSTRSSSSPRSSRAARAGHE